MRRSLAVATCTTSVAFCLYTTPASAVEVGLSASGAITVYSDLSACASLTFATARTFAGEFTASGAVQGPGTITDPVTGDVPVVGINSRNWYGCVAGAYAGAVRGDATYMLTVESAAGDYVSVLNCLVQNGRVTCT